MPPRYAYWTILVDGGPTAFRAAEPDELLPTLKRLQLKQPGATMKWFEKGKLWDSRDEAKEKLSAGYTVGPDGTLLPPPEGFERRTKSWRPGGEHRDPREKYQLAKKAKWQKFKQMVRARPGHGPKTEEDVFAPLDGPLDAPDDTSESQSFEPEPFNLPDGPSDDGPADESPRDDAPPATDWRGRPRADRGDAPAPRRAWSERPPKPAWRDKPAGGFGGGRPGWKPRPEGRGPKPEWRDRPKPFDRGGDRPSGPRPEWRDKPAGDSPRGPKPEWRDRPKPFDRGGEDRPRGPKPEWRDGPGGDRPRGPKPAWRDRPKPFDRSGDDRPRGPKPEWRDRPKTFDRGGEDRPRGPKPEWRDRPAGDRPRGPKPGGSGGFGRKPGGFGGGPRGRSGPPKKKY